MINASMNTALKVAFHGPRPYWFSRDVKVFGTSETSFGAPSGHAQNAVFVWGTLAAWIQTRIAWAIAIIIMFMIGISRIYLALHFPQVILLGWLFGAIMLWILTRGEKPVVSWLARNTIETQILFIFLLSLLLIALVGIASLALGGWLVPGEWISNAHLVFPFEPTINPFYLDNGLISAGALFGLASGWIWLNQRGGFLAKAALYQLILRYILGLVGVLILYVGVGYLIPDNASIWHIVYVISNSHSSVFGCLDSLPGYSSG